MSIYTQGTSVYILTVPSGHIKVGHSIDPERRMNQIQAEFYEQISMNGYTNISPGSPVLGCEMEQLIHLKLRPFATSRREWFKADIRWVVDVWHMAFWLLAIPPGHKDIERVMPNWFGQVSKKQLAKWGLG